LKESLKGDFGRSDIPLNTTGNVSTRVNDTYNTEVKFSEPKGTVYKFSHKYNLNEKEQQLPSINLSSNFAKKENIRYKGIMTPKNEQQQGNYINNINNINNINTTQSSAPFSKTGNNWNKKNVMSSTSNVPISSRDTCPDVNLELDDRCLSCTGHKNVITQVFKLACLNYVSKKVCYNDKLFEKRELFL